MCDITISMINDMNLLKNVDDAKIPKFIWHTYKSFPPEDLKQHIQSWINLNPDYTWLYMDDLRCSKFIQENFNKEFVDMYNSLPIPVMKADVWRVAVVYAYGGVYTDIDCMCLKPVSTWLDDKDRLVVGVEVDNGALLNYAFAAKPRHPALLSVLNRFMELYKEPHFMKSVETPVQNFGQYGFSDGILKYYNMNSTNDMLKGGNTNYYNENEKVKLENTKFILRQDNIFVNGGQQNGSTAIRHDVASLRFNNHNYVSWRKQQRMLYGV